MADIENKTRSIVFRPEDQAAMGELKAGYQARLPVDLSDTDVVRLALADARTLRRLVASGVVTQRDAGEEAGA
jgi:hypothetical protein